MGVLPVSARLGDFELDNSIQFEWNIGENRSSCWPLLYMLIYAHCLHLLFSFVSTLIPRFTSWQVLHASQCSRVDDGLVALLTKIQDVIHKLIHNLVTSLAIWLMLSAPYYVTRLPMSMIWSKNKPNGWGLEIFGSACFSICRIHASSQEMFFKIEKDCSGQKPLTILLKSGKIMVTPWFWCWG